MRIAAEYWTCAQSHFCVLATLCASSSFGYLTGRPVGETRVGKAFAFRALSRLGESKAGRLFALSKGCALGNPPKTHCFRKLK